jgi:hypothetical protein
MKKYITDEIIEKEMIKLGFPTDGDKIQDEEFVQAAVLKYYDVTITSDYTQNADYYVYPETTADGYEVFIATYDDRNISVNEHIHYYDNNLSTELEDAIRSSGGYCNIYVAEDFTDEYWYSDMFSEIYQSICEIQEQEIKDILIDEGYIETTT